MSSSRQVASQSAVPAVMIGNGTGPGTPFPKRRGPRLGPRRPKGMPEHLKSIEIKIGGLWFPDGSGGVEYIGGWTRYLHNVQPTELTIDELFLVSQMMLLDECLPTVMWYHAYGDDLPRGLRPLTSGEDVAAMFANCAEFGMWMARVYMQDLEFVAYKNAIGQNCVSYCIPQEIPAASRRFDAFKVHQDASEWHEAMMVFDDSELKRMEAFGERWYIHTDKYPRVPLDRSKQATYRNRDTTSFMMALKNPYWGDYVVKRAVIDEEGGRATGVICQLRPAREN